MDMTDCKQLTNDQKCMVNGVLRAIINNKAKTAVYSCYHKVYKSLKYFVFV